MYYNLFFSEPLESHKQYNSLSLNIIVYISQEHFFNNDIMIKFRKFNMTLYFRLKALFLSCGLSQQCVFPFQYESLVPDHVLRFVVVSFCLLCSKLTPRLPGWSSS